MPSQLWLVNTRSGGYRGARVLEALRDRVEACALDFSQLSKQLERGSVFNRIVVVGGDGSFASVLTSPYLPSRPVALIPLGTANDLAREFGMCRAIKGLSWDDLPGLVESLSETPLAIWDLFVDGMTRSFCNYCSLGFEGAVVADFLAWRATQTRHGVFKNRAVYGLLGAKWIATRLRGLTISSDINNAVQVPATRGIVVSNVKSHMGIGVLTPISDPGDNRIECVNASSPLDYLRMIASPMRLLPPLKSLVQGSEITIMGIPAGTHIQVDGEAHPPVMGGTVRVSFKKQTSILRS